MRWLTGALTVAASLVALTLAAAAADGPADDDPTTPELENRIDRATDRALEYLAKIQKKDGGWPTQGYDCATGSLAVMAFLAKGHQPGEQPYGEVIDKGIDYVLSKQKPNGFLAVSGQMYAHGISTLMLAEAVGQTKDKRNKQINDALAKAVKLILDAQKVPKNPTYRGGWRYQPTSADADISCTGWQLMALRSAKNAGAQVPDEAIAEAVAYVKRSAASGGGFGYQPGGATNHARAATGILALELCGQHHSKEALAAGDWILKSRLKPGGGEGYQYYTIYYCSQAMFQLGGKYWKQFWPAFAEDVLKLQRAEDGSFPLGVAAEHNAGPAYGTSMAVLALSVRYRLLPIYQR